MKALIYCRVSSQRQVTEGNGNTSQEKRCRDLATIKKLKVEKVFFEEGISGGLFDRPAMKSLLQHIDSNTQEEYTVIFDDLARFARDVQVHIRLKTEFMTRGVKLECLNFSFDDSAESEYAEMVLAAGNQYHRQANKRQVVQKQKARLENGYWPFCPPNGLISRKDPLHGKILIANEPIAGVFKEAINQFKDGTLSSVNETRMFINSKFNEQQINRTISLTGTNDMLRNLLYAGYIEYPKWKVPFKKAQHQGFISLDTFNSVQAKLNNKTKVWIRKDTSKDFPLRPHVICSECSKPLTASWSTGRSKKYASYFCRGKGCKYLWKVVHKTKIESEFEDLLNRVKPHEDVLLLLKEVMIDRWNERSESHNRSKLVANQNKTEIKLKISKLVDRLSKTTDDDLVTIYEEEIKKLKIESEKLNSITTKERFSLEEFGTASEKVFSAIKNPMGMWKSEDYNDKRAILFMYFDMNLRYNRDEGFGTEGLDCNIKLMGDLKPPINGNVEMSGVIRSPKNLRNNFYKHSQFLVVVGLCSN